MNSRWELNRVRSARQATVFLRLYELYCHELAPLTAMRPDKQGCYADATLGADLFKDKGVELWLASDLEGPAGFLWLEKKGTGWTVDQLYVLPLSRRSGLAAALVRHGMERHPGGWEVFVLENNQAALAFWRALLPQLGAWTEKKEPLDGRPGIVWRTA